MADVYPWDILEHAWACEGKRFARMGNECLQNAYQSTNHANIALSQDELASLPLPRWFQSYYQHSSGHALWHNLQLARIASYQVFWWHPLVSISVIHVSIRT